MLKRLTTLCIFASLAIAPAFAEDFSDKIKTAMQSDERSDKEKLRDRNRLPAHTLSFFGIEENMRVLEIMPGRGWYTKLLAPALKEKGQLYLAVYTKRVNDQLNKENVFAGTKLAPQNPDIKYNETEKLYDLTGKEFGLKALDAVLTFRNYHNLTLEGRKGMNDAAFKALKPGGIYGVVDHTRRHMESGNRENQRRIDPVLAIKEILEAGFEFVDYSNLHYRADDELRYEVGRKSVTGNTDRFTLLFKKPAK